VATILIVGDLSEDRNLVLTLLRNRGHRLVEAANGDEALAVAQSGLPDLVVADVLVPVKNGDAFVRRLRLDPGTRGIPVLLYASSGGDREAALGLLSGPTYVLKKSSTLEDVLELVGRALSGESET